MTFFLFLNMEKYNSPVSYFGNKTNDIKHFKEFLPYESKIIVEVFGGGFSLI